MGNGHTGSVADVERETVAGFVDALEAGNLGSEHEQPGEELAVGPLDVLRRRDVLAGDDEGMDRGARVDVADGEGVVVLGDLLDGDLAGGHFAEQAIHERIFDCRLPIVDCRWGISRREPLGCWAGGSWRPLRPFAA